eukprot:2337898-Pleurochrysis_carterae.AAC.1
MTHACSKRPETRRSHRGRSCLVPSRGRSKQSWCPGPGSGSAAAAAEMASAVEPTPAMEERFGMFGIAERAGATEPGRPRAASGGGGGGAPGVLAAMSWAAAAGVSLPVRIRSAITSGSGLEEGSKKGRGGGCGSRATGCQREETRGGHEQRAAKRTGEGMRERADKGGNSEAKRKKQVNAGSRAQAERRAPQCEEGSGTRLSQRGKRDAKERAPACERAGKGRRARGGR